jgi:hypothetical protein
MICSPLRFVGNPEKVVNEIGVYQAQDMHHKMLIVARSCAPAAIKCMVQENSDAPV